LQQTFRPSLSKLSKRRQISVIYPHFEQVRGGVEAWSIARWKDCVECLLSVIELLFLSLTVEVLEGKTRQDSLLSGVGRSARAKISGERGRPWGICFGFYKTKHILLSDSANCTVLRAVVLTQYRCVTDGRTDRRTDRRNCYRKYSSCNASIAARCKKGLTSSPSNYRPISVTCVCCCVMERIINLELIMVALWNRADHYIFMLWFVVLLLLFLFPRLISAAAHWMSAILPHMV